MNDDELFALSLDRQRILKLLAPHLIPASGSDPHRAEHDKQKSKHRKKLRKELRENGNQIITRVLHLNLEPENVC